MLRVILTLITSFAIEIEVGVDWMSTTAVYVREDPRYSVTTFSVDGNVRVVIIREVDVLASTVSIVHLNLNS